MNNFLVLYVVLCLIVGLLGRKTRLGALRSALLSFLLTPLVIFIYLLLFAAVDGDDRRQR